MYPACILHVYRMSPSYQIHLSLDDIRMTFEIHVSHHVSRNLGCIPHVSWSPPQASKLVSHCLLACLITPCRYMYLACIPHVSCISDTYLSGYIWDTCIVSIQDICIVMYLDCILKCRHDACKIHVSWVCISVYPDVSWWRVRDTRILMYLDMYPVWHQGSAQDTCILMDLTCISIVFWTPSWETRQDTCILPGYIRIHQDTSGYVSDRKCESKCTQRR